MYVQTHGKHAFLVFVFSRRAANYVVSDRFDRSVYVDGSSPVFFQTDAVIIPRPFVCLSSPAHEAAIQQYATAVKKLLFWLRLGAYFPPPPPPPSFMLKSNFLFCGRMQNTIFFLSQLLFYKRVQCEMYLFGGCKKKP